MKRTQIYLDDEQDSRLSKRATAAGTTKSALIREAIEAYLSVPVTPDAGLARFRAMLDQLGREPLSFEDGKEYVERIRALDALRQAEIDRDSR